MPLPPPPMIAGKHRSKQSHEPNVSNRNSIHAHPSLTSSTSQDGLVHACCPFDHTGAPTHAPSESPKHDWQMPEPISG